MGSVAVTVERQAPPGRRSVRLEFNPGPRSVVCDLVEKRAAWTIRLVDLEQEYAAAIVAIERLDAEIKRGNYGNTES